MNITSLTYPNVNNYNSNSDVKIYVNGDDVTLTSNYSLTNTIIFKKTFGSVFLIVLTLYLQ